MPRLFLSTVGTSLLTNYAVSQGDKKISLLLRDTANFSGEELTDGQKEVIDRIAAAAEAELKDADFTELRSLSAELNGLYTYGQSEGRIKLEPNDYHVLLTTDTYQGLKTAHLLENHLRDAGVKSVEIEAPRGLSTKNRSRFTSGVKDVINWCEETLPGYRESRYRIVFNLVGGFKSLQGYMSTLGMFYADEIIYIFEAPTADLIRIPRLPVVFDEIPLLREKAVIFAFMENGHIATKEEVEDIPEIYLEHDQEGSYTLSTWGLLVWNRNKQDILGGELLEFPGLIYERTFKKDFNSIFERSRKANIQTKLAKVSLLYRERGLEALCSKGGGLYYKDYENKVAPSGRNIGHFRINLDWRISCVPDGENLVLRCVGPHDYVNENP